MADLAMNCHFCGATNHLACEHRCQFCGDKGTHRGRDCRRRHRQAQSKQADDASTSPTFSRVVRVTSVYNIGVNVYAMGTPGSDPASKLVFTLLAPWGSSVIMTCENYVGSQMDTNHDFHSPESIDVLERVARQAYDMYLLLQQATAM